MANMQTAQTSFSFYLLPGFSLQAFSCAVEVLRLANEATGRDVYSWHVISEDGQPIMSSCRLTVSAESDLRNQRERTRKPNLISAAVVCGGSAIPAPDRQLDAWLRECRMRRIPLICIGSGTVVVARAGLADGRRCAVHWEQLPLFCEQFPGIESTQAAFEYDRDLHTCSGGDASFDMFLNLVEQDHGSVVVNRICEKAIAYRLRSAGERQRLPLHSRVKLNHRAVMKVIGLMEASLDEPVSIEGLVALSGISRRQIERLFERELGRSPSRYYLELRLERAHLLLVSTNLPVVEVAVACGFISPSHFSKVYREAYGCAPHQTRLTARANGHADLIDSSLLGLERSEISQQSVSMTA
jgi:transcriptional regulator GlxA family with amidase domain